MFSRISRAWRSRSCPAIRTTPDVFANVVVRMEMVVVFPAPFGPRNAKNSPGYTSKVIPSTAAVGDWR